MINWINSGTLPYNVFDKVSLGGLDSKKTYEYNNMIESVGKEIFESRKGYYNNGSVSTDPKDKNAVPYN